MAQNASVIAPVIEDVEYTEIVEITPYTPFLEQESQESIVIPPALVRIAECESDNEHFNEDGTVIRGRENPQDIGRWQINLDAWGDRAKELGYDIFDEKDNALMALYIFYEEGIHHWRYSKSCWSS